MLSTAPGSDFGKAYNWFPCPNIPEINKRIPILLRSIEICYFYGPEKFWWRYRVDLQYIFLRTTLVLKVHLFGLGIFCSDSYLYTHFLKCGRLQSLWYKKPIYKIISVQVILSDQSRVLFLCWISLTLLLQFENRHWRSSMAESSVGMDNYRLRSVCCLKE